MIPLDAWMMMPSAERQIDPNLLMLQEYANPFLPYGNPQKKLTYFKKCREKQRPSRTG
jgi:hypothetical protein